MRDLKFTFSGARVIAFAILLGSTFSLPINAQHQSKTAPRSVSTTEPLSPQPGSAVDLATPRVSDRAPYQSDDASVRKPRPRLTSVEVARVKDELARAGNDYIILRSGQDILLPITPGAPLRLSLDSGISTNKMKDGVRVTRLLPLKSPLETRYQGIYGDRDYLVLTEFSGRNSGFKDRSLLLINPMQFQVEVRPTDYVVIDILDGKYVVLKPGKWRFTLRCSLKQVVTPTGQTWTAPTNSETDGIKGDKFGREHREEIYEDYSGLTSFPRGEIAFGIAQLKGLWRYLLHRPNIELPAATDLYFTLNQISVTYIGPLLPTDPATVVHDEAVDLKKPNRDRNVPSSLTKKGVQE
jgi:hypothetical protein